MTDLKPEDLVKLREIAEKATPGPWQIVSDFPARAIKREGGIAVVQTPNQNAVSHYGPANTWDGVQGENNAEYIAAFSPDVVLSLLADRARMEKALRDLIRCDDDARRPLQNGAGLLDSIDNTGQFYPSQDLGDCLKAARQALGASQ